MLPNVCPTPVKPSTLTVRRLSSSRIRLDKGVPPAWRSPWMAYVGGTQIGGSTTDRMSDDACTREDGLHKSIRHSDTVTFSQNEPLCFVWKAVPFAMAVVVLEAHLAASRET
jgi:hypothetical protein